MGTFEYAGLRFPVSLAAGFFVTGTLFWTLWSFTDHTFEVMDTTPIKIDFTRQEFADPPEERQPVKPVLKEPTDIDITLPPIGARETGDIGPPTTWKDGPIVTLPPGSGLPIGRDTEAAPLVRVPPTYPPREAQRGIEGWVRVQFDIAASGAVTNVVVVESEPRGTGFDKAATDAVARWRYNPSVVNGQTVERVGLQTLVRFTLDGE